MQAALKHPAWDNLTDNSPQGWMEFYKSLRRNAMTFAIALVSFLGAFNMAYRELCLCRLGIPRYHSMGRSLFSILQPLLPQDDTYVCSQVELVANNSSNGFELLWTLQKC
jgi:hypothetical protein